MFAFIHRPARKAVQVLSTKGFSTVSLNDEALPLLRDPSRAGTDRDRELVRVAKSRGWLDADGRLNGTIRRADREPWLRRIQIETALTCNFSCTYCYSGSAPTRREKLTADEIVDILHQAADMGVAEVCFTGGEFLLYKGWQQLVETAHGLGLIVDVHTNGYLLNPAAIDLMRRCAVRQVQVTLESHLAEIHDSIRGRKGSWRQVTGNITAARAAGLYVKIVTQVHRRNIGTIRDTAKWIHDQLGEPVNLDRIMGDDELTVSQSEFWAAVSPLLGLGMRASRICEPADAGDPGVEPECGVGINLAYITADGEIALCPTMTSREHADFAGPNIRVTRLADGWYDGAAFTGLRNVNCENTGHCPAASECKGGCRSNAYAETGRVTAPDVVACNINKNPTPVFIDFIGRYREGDFSVAEAGR